MLSTLKTVDPGDLIYCSCGFSDNQHLHSRQSIQCCRCSNWFHSFCVSLTDEEVIRKGDTASKSRFTCPTCESSQSSSKKSQCLVSCQYCGRSGLKGERGLNAHLRKCASRPNDTTLPPQNDHEESLESVLATCRSSVKTLSHLPKATRAFAADKLAQQIGTTVENNDVDSWKDLLLFSYAAFHVPAKDKKSLTVRVHENIKKCQLPPTQGMPAHNSGNLAKRVHAKVSDHDIRGAIRILTSDDSLATPDLNTLQKLREKHPSPATPITQIPPSADDFHPPVVKSEEVLEAILSFSPGSAAGLDGFKPQHLKELLSHKNESGPRLLIAITNLINLMLSGKICESICRFVYGGSLCALKKKDGGIRPIAIGNTFRRIASKVACRSVKEGIGKYLQPKQLGFATKGGCEIAIHCARKYISTTNTTGKVLLKIDYKNAFNSVCRDRLLHEIRTRTPHLYPYMWQSYSEPSSLFFGEQRISSESGCQQGDPMGPATFSMVIHPLVESLSSELNIWYLDDGTLADTWQTVLKDFQNIISESRALGLEVNPSKCELFILDDLDQDSIKEAFVSCAPEISIVTKDSLNLLGAPLTEESIGDTMQVKTSQLELLMQRLPLLEPHIAYFLLKNCLAVPKLMYLLRTTPLWKSEFLGKLDLILKTCLEQILNVILDDTSWTQASLPISSGGLGIRKTSDLALPAYISSVHSIMEMSSYILPSDLLLIEFPFLNEAISLWKSNANCELNPPFPEKQENWDIPIVKQIFNSLPRDTLKEKSRLLAVSQKESGDWLNALPSPHLGTVMDPDSLRIAVALRLNLKVYEKHVCVCGANTDEYGHHGLSCMKSAGRFSRHAALNDLLKRALNSAEIPSQLEPIGLSRDDGRRPDGVTLIPWKTGKSLVWDSTCADTFSNSYLDATSKAAGGAADIAVKKKHSKYKAIRDNHNYTFVAFAVETLGTWSQEALEFSKELGSRLSLSSGERRSLSYFRQRISIAIQRGNAASILGTIPNSTSLSEIYYFS